MLDMSTLIKASSQVFTYANILTLFRLALFCAFVFYLFKEELEIALLLFIFAWALDAVDGWLARYFRQATDFGSQLDKLIDRIVIALGVLALIRTGYLPQMAILLLTKDFGMLPALTIHSARGESPKGLGWYGKIMTAVQGATILWLLLNPPYQEVVIITVAIAGGFVAVRQLRRII